LAGILPSFAERPRRSKVVLMRTLALFVLVVGAAYAQTGWQVRRLVGPITYPTLARAARIQGTVELSCSIANDGTVKNCHAASGHPLLSAAAIENAKGWLFRSTEHTGPSSSEVSLFYSFDLVGDPVREPKETFTFEFPSRLQVISQPACADHAPCTPAEQLQWQLGSAGNRRNPSGGTTRRHLMPVSRIMIALGIHLIVPLLGIGAYVLLNRRMRRALVPSPPVVSYFILFATFGGWLLVVLTALFWVWSSMASLGVGYLIFIAPIVTTILAWRLRQSRSLSAYHHYAFLASIAYTGLICVGWLIVPLLRFPATM
jgi:TonB family protein